MKIYKLTVIIVDREEVCEDDIVKVIEGTDLVINDRQIFPLVVDIENAEVPQEAIDRWRNAPCTEIDTIDIDTADEFGRGRGGRIMMYSVAAVQGGMVNYTFLISATSFEDASEKFIAMLRNYGKCQQQNMPHTNTEFWYINQCFQYRFTQFKPGGFLWKEADCFRESAFRVYVYWEHGGEVKSSFQEVDGW